MRRAKRALWPGGIVAFLVAGCVARDDSPAPLPPPTGPPDVWLVTLDTFRPDRAGGWGDPRGLTPSLDRVLRGAVVAPNAYAPAPLTAPSHASVLTGLEPPSHGVRLNGRYALDPSIPTLATLLRDEGFVTGAFIAAFPLEGQFGFDQGFDRFDEDLRESRASVQYYPERPAAEVADVAIRWVRDLDDDARWLLWTHFFDPHQPILPPPPFSTLPNLDGYEQEIRAMDHAIGRLARELELVGGGRRPVTAVVSDHGEALGDHRELTHGILVHESTMRGLFAIAAPPGTEEARRVPDTIFEPIVRYADLLPTLLDVLGLPSEDPFDGRSLLAEDDGTARGTYGETWYPASGYGWSPLTSWRDERWAYLEGPEPELYDRIADPGEQRNVIAEHPEVAAALSARIAAIAREPRAPEVALDSHERDKLLALGYLSTEGDLSYDATKNPKRLISSVNTLFRAITLSAEGRCDAALPLLRRAYAIDSENVMTVFHLANCLRETGDRGTAKEYYRRAIELNSQADEAWAHLAVLEFESGRKEKAFSLFDEALTLNPSSFSLLMSAGDLHAEVGRTDRALSLYERASEADPHRTEPWTKLAELAEARGDRAEAERMRERSRQVASPRGS